MTGFPTMRAAFRTTVSGGGKYEMVFRFPSMDDLHVADDEWRTALATPASDVAPVEYETLIAAGFDEYAAHCALRTEPDGGFCHAYFYSDGQWRFQTDGNDLTLADGTILRCVLTKRLFAHPPAHPVDPAGGEALREAVRDALASELGDTYDCGRVWEAWSVGTMGEDDFTPVNDRVDEIADAILAALKGPAA